MDPIIEEIRKVAADVAADHCVELVHAEMVGSKRDSVVRIFIDKPEGIGIEDCTQFSHAVEAILDVKDIVPGAYVLEVSSPGIERELYSLADFVRFTGEMARVSLKSEIDGQKNFVGRIKAVDDRRIEMEDRTRGDVSFDHSLVKKANLKMDLGKELKAR